MRIRTEYHKTYYIKTSAEQKARSKLRQHTHKAEIALRVWRKKLARFGLTETTYQELLDSQNKQCAICGSCEKLQIDHCHTTKKIRGLLCLNCNVALGHFDDSITHLKRAIQYLEEKK